MTEYTAREKYAFTSELLADGQAVGTFRTAAAYGHTEDELAAAIDKYEIEGPPPKFTATWTRLKKLAKGSDGEWGVRIVSRDVAPQPGDTIIVRTRAGKETEGRIMAIRYQKGDVYICAFVAKEEYTPTGKSDDRRWHDGHYIPNTDFSNPRYRDHHGRFDSGIWEEINADG